ncbi:MAG: DNA recombination protein RmuC [Deferribacteraceae bacterium]|jgi:DNA recombination protein RmuC|nr:DNA recombination protein RmuC [Deferribacteraceae bacterium]
MNQQLIFNISIIVWQVIAVILLIIVLVRKFTINVDLSSIIDLLRRNADEQRDSVSKQIADGATEQFRRFSVIQESVQNTLTISREETNKQLRVFQEQVNYTLESKIRSLQESNERRLSEMQGVVDEKLQKTLETRLSQSFERVSKQLDGVQQGLGEMKNLAADAKSLKNALINVKERGTYGEVRLEKLLSDILAPNQYELNIEIAAGKRVEFAIKLPGNDDTPLLLPIDSKFPIEDYNRLLDATDKVAIDEARKALALRVRNSAKEICDKYISPPKTTDFALMFLPTEGLYAEVVQNVALFEELRDKYKVTAVGSTTLSAYLASLQMGFKTLAMQARTNEAWDKLREVKAEFSKFGDVLAQAHQQIQRADQTLEKLVTTRTTAMNRKLRSIEELNEPSIPLLLESEIDDED